MKAKKQLESGSIEVIVIVILVLLVGAVVAWRVYATRQNSTTKPTSTSTADNNQPVTTPSSTSDPYAEWQSFCSDAGGVCFKYPPDWKFKTTASGADVTSPSGKVGINYVANIGGLGGACDPQTCYFMAKDIAKPAGAKIGNLKVVSGIYTGKDAGVSIPELAVMSDKIIAQKGLVTGKDVDVGAIYYLFTNPTDGTKSNKLLAYDTSNATYKQFADAEEWLSQPEVVTARQILMSVTLK